MTSYECLMKFKAYMNKPALSIALVTGGQHVDPRKQEAELMRSQIVVATTSGWWRRRWGVVHFFNAMIKYHLSFNNLLFFILDEADK